MEKVYDYIIIGGGIIGLSTAYKLSKRCPNDSILVLEKENQLAAHQTGNNSGVIHSGIYYKPGSLKAKNCINGREQLINFAKNHNINFEICGKLIIAVEEKDLESLEEIYSRGIKNGLDKIKILSFEESKKIEPNVNCIKSIYVPYAGIIDYSQVVKKLSEQFLKQNSKNKVLLSTKVRNIENSLHKKNIKTNNGTFSSYFTIVTGGIYSDELANMDGIYLNLQIIGFRGDYYNIIDTGKQKVKNLIYPVPDLALPFLGVHLTKNINGQIEAGPNAVFSFKKEGYSRMSFSLFDTIRAFKFKGLWKLFFCYWKIGLIEYRRAFSKKRFLFSLKYLVPDLKLEEIVRGKSGVRAQALDSNGNLIDDFLIKRTTNSLHVINAPSPAATASLAIADEIIESVFHNKVERKINDEIK